ncbi:MAG: ADP-forming succinate--CoA ligase subunit beta [Bradymonadales bacterium]|nr:ADP-forming succinate--CoA ligase subunit beta [Bradymonadales bacterium]
MKIHEYQAKKLFRKHGIEVPRGIPAFSVEDAAKAAHSLGGDTFVVKAQIHAGGRGKAGGIKVAHSVEEVRRLASQLLDHPLVTHQTTAQGRIVRRLYIEEGVRITRELYLAILLDRELSCPVMVASPEGGTDIEEVARTHPEQIFREVIHPLIGLAEYQCRRMALALGLRDRLLGQAVALMKALYGLFWGLDCSLVEINPLVVTASDSLLALDAKINFDSNALTRHSELLELRDLDEQEPQENEAGKYQLNYIKLEGSIGCMVNGAGLAMATMDIISHYGGQPANFLDVGGNANRERVAAAFKIITADPAVKAIFVNIFGGIVRCDMLAQGVVEAVREVGLTVPLVVRLDGTQVERGKQILTESGLNMIVADSMADGARRAVQAAG